MEALYKSTLPLPLCRVVYMCAEVLYSSKKPMVFVLPDSSLLDAFCALHGNTIHRLLVVDALRQNPLYTMTHHMLLRYVYAKVSLSPFYGPFLEVNPG